MWNSWQALSLIGMCTSAVLFFPIPYVVKRYLIPVEFLCVAWFTGTIFWMLMRYMQNGIFDLGFKAAGAAGTVGYTIISLFFVGGFLIGGPGNEAYFRALKLAPNPGYPVAIVNTNTLLLLVVGAAATLLFPAVGLHAPIEKILGVVLVVIGMYFLLS